MSTDERRRRRREEPAEEQCDLCDGHCDCNSAPRQSREERQRRAQAELQRQQQMEAQLHIQQSRISKWNVRACYKNAKRAPKRRSAVKMARDVVQRPKGTKRRTRRSKFESLRTKHQKAINKRVKLAVEENKASTVPQWMEAARTQARELNYKRVGIELIGDQEYEQRIAAAVQRSIVLKRIRLDNRRRHVPSRLGGEVVLAEEVEYQAVVGVFHHPGEDLSVAEVAPVESAEVEQQLSGNQQKLRRSSRLAKKLVMTARKAVNVVAQGLRRHR